jgi:hemolysin D
MGGFFDRKQNDTLEYEFLPPALEIEETPPSPVKRVLIWVIFAIVVTFSVWSWFGRVEIVAEARGKVIPDGRVKVVQPMEEGIIRAILVEEGQRVKEGQILIDLDPTIKQADVDSNIGSLRLQYLDRERLVDEFEGRNPGEGLSRSARKNKLQIPPALMAVQARLKSARESEHRAREEAQRLVIAQRESALTAAEAVLVKLERTHSIVKEQESSLKELYEGGFASRMEWRDKDKELLAAQQDIEAQKKQIQSARASLEEARKGLETLTHERDKSVLTDLVEREKTISSTEGEVTKARKRAEYERLVSPVNGTVHGLATYTIGGIVKPAQDVVSIVPDGTPLVVEAMVQNKDIGFVKIGQETEVKLDTFPFQKYGTIRGKVIHLSPDAVEDEKLGPVYRMRTSIERPVMRVDGRDVPVTPGMSASVEVKTGDRRIIEFFLSPIIKYARESLTLR